MKIQGRNWRSYILTFMEAYRQEVTILKEQNKFLFKWCIKEQTLEEPCQIEALELKDPYGIVWLFLFDDTKKDCLFSIHRATWKNIPETAKTICSKYPTLKIQTKLLKMLNGFRESRYYDYLYSLDGFKNVLAIYFSYDVREKGIGKITPDSDPNTIAEAIFHLNRGQESSYW